MDVYRRIKEATDAVVERLGDDKETDADADDTSKPKPKAFRDSLVTNLQWVIDILPDLNLTGNEALAEMGKELSTALDGVQPDTLRPHKKDFDADKRDKVRETAEDISRRLAGYFG